MRVRFPKPLKGWRVFAGEVGTIVLGVLIALGAQELVQSLHWKREVRETRKALDAELARDLAAFEYRIAERPCVAARVSEIQRWAESFRTGKPLRLKHEIIPQPGFAIRTEVWELVDGEIAARIPLKPRLNYAGIYSSMRSFEALVTGEGQAWDVILEHENSASLSDADIRKIVKAVGDIAAGNEILAAFQTTTQRHARELGIKPDPNLLRTANPMVEEIRKAACEPYL